VPIDNLEGGDIGTKEHYDDGENDHNSLEMLECLAVDEKLPE